MLKNRLITNLLSVGLWSVRLGWLVTFALVLSIYQAMMPYNYIMTFDEWSVQNAGRQLPEIMSYGTFVSLIVLLEYINGGLFIGVALLIAWRRRSDWFALYVSATLLLLSLIAGISGNLDVLLYPRWITESVPRSWLNSNFTFVALTLLLLLFFLFPSGRFSPGWLSLAAVAGVLWIWSPGIPILYRTLEPLLHRLGITDHNGWFLYTGALLGVMAVGLGSQIYRYRSISSDAERQQIKWLLLGLSIPLLSVVLSALGGAWGVHPALAEVLVFFAWMAIPLTIALAIFRHGFWHIEVVVRRSLVYGALALVISLLYILVVGGLSQLLSPSDNWLFSILATGLIAILFHPLRLQLQGAVNRLFYGQRDEPAKVLSDLSARLAATVAPEDALTAVVQTVCGALKLPHAALLIKEGAGMRAVASVGDALPVIESLSIHFRRDVVGELRVSPRRPDDALTAGDRRLLAELANQSGALLHTLQLTTALQRSREQLVSAREEERRRLRRDLHDGLGPQLASFNLKLDAVRNLMQREPVQATALLAGCKTQTQEMLADLRHIVNDLRPAALDQLGLISALQQHVEMQRSGGALQIEFKAPAAMPALPAAVEVAAYRIVLEALTNVVRHAQAHHCTISLAFDHALSIDVLDDGGGLPATLVAGMGITSMRERAAELGGSYALESSEGRGVHIHAVLPVAPVALESEA